ncbi:MAG: DUF2798 domain-containing protein [Lysobacter sp.]|nr:DUF2798 domain-containing protein [Lysobacter sp.]
MNSNEHDAAVVARAQRLLPGTLAMFMSAFVAGVVTAINTGLEPGFALRWLKAWSIALPAAIVAAYLFRPAAMALARTFARFSPPSGRTRN